MSKNRSISPSYRFCTNTRNPKHSKDIVLETLMDRYWYFVINLIRTIIKRSDAIAMSAIVTPSSIISKNVPPHQVPIEIHRLFGCFYLGILFHDSIWWWRECHRLATAIVQPGIRRPGRHADFLGRRGSGTHWNCRSQSNNCQDNCQDNRQDFVNSIRQFHDSFAGVVLRSGLAIPGGWWWGIQQDRWRDSDIPQRVPLASVPTSGNEHGEH